MSRRTRIRFVLVFLAVLGGAVGQPFAEAVRTEVLVDSGDVIVLELTVEDFHSRPVSIDGKSFQSLRIPGEAIGLDRGAPALPYVSRSVIVPDDAGMTLRVLHEDYYEIPARIAPSKGNLLRSVDPASVPHEFGAAYAADAFYPRDVAVLGEPYILRDHRGVVVRVNPFRYNPAGEILRVYERIVVELTVEGPGQTNVLYRGGRARRPSGAFEQLYQSQFVNHSPTPDYSPLVDEGEMLIICHDPWIGKMTPFVQHKASIGIAANVVGVSTIGNDAASIKSYIQGVYDTGNLAFVLLVGDIEQVASPMDGPGASDPSYSKLAGDDDYPEIIVGRFSAATVEDVETQVQRTIFYETQPATEQDWFHRATGIASAEGAGIGDEGQSDTEHAQEIRSWLMAAGYTEVDELYDPEAEDTQVAAAVNLGRGLINYTGHGNATGWGTTGFNVADVDALINTEKLPFIMSVACNNGQFEDYDSCFAEAWLRATDQGQPTGAIGAYASTILQSWAPPMEAQDEFNLLLTDAAEPYHSFGALCFAGSCSMMDAYGQGGVDMFNTWILFGDPSLRVIGTPAPSQGLWVTPFDGLEAAGPAGGPFAPGSIDYTLHNLDETPLEYTVVPAQPWVSASNGTGTIPAGGTAVVTVALNERAANFDHGSFAGAVSFLNLSGGAGDSSRAVGLEVGQGVIQHRETLDVSPGWSMEALWEFGPPLGLGGVEYGNPDPGAAATGDNVYGVALTRGDYKAYINGPWYLTTTPFDLTDRTGSTLRFQRWLNVEALPVASARVEVSTDGSTWHEIWTNTEEVASDAWSLQQYDVSALVDGQPNVQFRWSYGVHQTGAYECSGWNVDDVEVWGVPPSVRTTLTLDDGGLAWTPVVGAFGYDVVRGDLGTLRETHGDFSVATLACVADDVAALFRTYTDTPDPGEGFWILVRAVSGSGPLTFQALSESQVGIRDEEIQASGVGCP